ncbi:hypothetical protein H1P_3660004 [Hyella patelloides LEGE 07179]|uniref:Uncharacterized protein n=1 Tax=Hyella patelloides LEGE 07179 TaxID=945734 RepID=A0A563VWH7_9CYAN|nr:hypothetical protein H1P_3660004 [Hyella patelloides LEGE 07179]
MVNGQDRDFNHQKCGRSRQILAKRLVYYDKFDQRDKKCSPKVSIPTNQPII